MVVRARDLRVAIKDQGFERGVVHTLELMLEEQGEIRQHIRQMGELIDGCIKQMEVFMQISTGMRDIIEGMRRAAQGEADDREGKE